MLTCITCSRAPDQEPVCKTQLNGSRTPKSWASKETTHNLTAKIKGLSLKFSGACSKPSPRATSNVHLKATPQRSLEPDDKTPEITKSCGSGCESLTSTVTSTTPGCSKRAAGTPKLESAAVGRCSSIVFVEEEEPREWIVEAETGVLITLLSLPKGKNHLKHVSFSKQIFDKCRARLWWIENYDKLVELYNVERTNREALCLITKSEIEEERCATEATQQSLVMPPRRHRDQRGPPGQSVGMGNYS